MGIMDTLKDAAVGAISKEMGQNPMAMATTLLNEMGGVDGLAAKFNSAGLQTTIQSWIGSGENLPISAEQIQNVLGHSSVQAIATKLGIDPTQLLGQLSQNLPALIDKLTPKA